MTGVGVGLKCCYYERSRNKGTKDSAFTKAGTEGLVQQQTSTITILTA